MSLRVDYQPNLTARITWQKHFHLIGANVTVVRQGACHLSRARMTPLPPDMDGVQYPPMDIPRCALTASHIVRPTTGRRLG
jgi:hypothetical protein